MDVYRHRGLLVFVIHDEEDIPEVIETQDSVGLAGLEKNKILYVCMEGTDDKYLHPERFLIKNHDASLVNHFMWEGLFTQDQQDERMWEMINQFIDTGKQFVIENYKFTKDEPFYDYSGGREDL